METWEYLEIPRCGSLSGGDPEAERRLSDFQRLRDWVANPCRSSANVAFTAGPLRDAAYAVESGLAAQSYEPLTAEECHAFRAFPCTFDEMLRRAHFAGRFGLRGPEGAHRG